MSKRVFFFEEDCRCSFKKNRSLLDSWKDNEAAQQVTSGQKATYTFIDYLLPCLKEETRRSARLLVWEEEAMRVRDGQETTTLYYDDQTVWHSWEDSRVVYTCIIITPAKTISKAVNARSSLCIYEGRRDSEVRTQSLFSQRLQYNAERI